MVIRYFAYQLIYFIVKAGSDGYAPVLGGLIYTLRIALRKGVPAIDLLCFKSLVRVRYEVVDERRLLFDKLLDLLLRKAPRHKRLYKRFATALCPKQSALLEDQVQLGWC